MKDLGSEKSLGRPGQASEVATSFVFLATPDSSFYCRLYLFELALKLHRGLLTTAYRWASFALLSAGRLDLFNGFRYIEMTLVENHILLFLDSGYQRVGP
jgi:hypothetical protein